MTPSIRLSFVPLSDSEYPDYLQYYSNDTVMKYVTGRGLEAAEVRERFARSIEVAQQFPGFGIFTVHRRSDNLFVGIAKVAPYGYAQVEVGYGLLPEHWNQGYGTEILAALVSYAQAIEGKPEIIALVSPDNEVSRRLLKKLGFQMRGGGETETWVLTR